MTSQDFLAVGLHLQGEIISVLSEGAPSIQPKEKSVSEEFCVRKIMF